MSVQSSPSGGIYNRDYKRACFTLKVSQKEALAYNRDCFNPKEAQKQACEKRNFPHFKLDFSSALNPQAITDKYISYML